MSSSRFGPIHVRVCDLARHRRCQRLYDGSGKYPWSYNSAAQRFESGNVNVDKSTSTTSFVFTLDRQRIISFDFGVSSEAGFDKATITLSNGAETNNIAAGISGAKSDTYNGILTAGTWTLTVSFDKDDASRGGDDPPISAD